MDSPGGGEVTLSGPEEAAGSACTASPWRMCHLLERTSALSRLSCVEQATGPSALGPEGVVLSTTASAPLSVRQKSRVPWQAAHSFRSLATTKFENVLVYHNQKK